MYLDIEVTQDDIDKGITLHGSMDPLGLAIERELLQRWPKLKHDIFVHVNHAYINDNRYIFQPAKETCQFIIDFDNGVPVKPFKTKLIQSLLEIK